MKTKKDYGKKKVSGKKYNSRLKNKKRTRMITINSLRGGSNTHVSSTWYSPIRINPSLRHNSYNKFIRKKTYYGKPSSFNVLSKYNTINNESSSNNNKPSANNESSSNNNKPSANNESSSNNNKPTANNESSSNNKKILEVVTAPDLLEDYKYINKSSHYVSIFNNKNKIEYSFNIDKLSVDKLQFYLENGLLKITDNNKIQINSEILIMNKQIKSYSKAGGIFYNVYEDDTCKLLNETENLNLFFDNKYYFNVRLSSNYDNPIIKHNKYEEWLLQIIYNINQIKKENNPENARNIDLFLKLQKQNLISSQTNIFNNCDLAMDHSKLIIESIKIGSEKYLIVGYPDMSMRPFLKLYNENKGKIDTIHNEYAKNIMTYISELWNFVMTDKIDVKDMPNEIYKFFDKNNMYFKYITEYYDRIVNNFKDEYKKTQPQVGNKDPDNEETGKEESDKEESGKEDSDKETAFITKKFKEEYNIIYDPQFIINFKNLKNKINNEIGFQYLHKPNIYIKYVFIILKEVDYLQSFYTKSMQLDDPVGKNLKIYVPAIFNFRELKGKHKIILDKIQYHINNTLPIMYGINTIGENIFYSNYKYGEIFYIETEYLHTLTNIFNFSYKYKTTIILQEIIYMLSYLKNNENLSRLRIDYYIKKNELVLPTKKLLNKSVKQNKSNENNDSQITLQCNKHNNNPDEVINKELNSIFNSLNTKILTLFQETGFIYDIIYKNEENFYYIKIQSNLCNIDLETLVKIKSEVNSIYMCNEIKTYIINPMNLNIFKIIKHTIIKLSDCSTLLQFNPIIINELMKNSGTFEKNMNIINKLFISRIETFLIPNLYIKKPILLSNILETDLYKKEFKYFKDNFKINNSYTTHSFNVINPSSRVPVFEIHKFDMLKIKKIYFNKNKCNYNFIEFEENIGNPLENNTKLIVWVVPLNATHESNDIIDSFEGFENNPNRVKPTYLGNFMDLNYTHLEMLTEIKNTYINSKHNVCALNIQSITPTYNCLHFHIFNNNLYKDKFIENDLGVRISTSLDIYKIINNIKWRDNYYNNYNIRIIKS
jgi:hypothetical protein